MVRRRQVGTQVVEDRRGRVWDVEGRQALVEVPRDEAARAARGERRPQGATRTGDPGGEGAPPATHRAGRERDREPEAGPGSARPRGRRVREGERFGSSGAAPRRPGRSERQRRQGGALRGDGGSVRQQGARDRTPDQRARGATAAGDERGRGRQGGGDAELGDRAAEARRAGAAPLDARSGAHARGPEQGDADAHVDHR